jgi:hypothetical protein
MTSKRVDAFEEVPTYFAAGDETLFGILTTPLPGPDPTLPAVVLVAGGWHSTSADRNQTFVRMARELADDGMTTFRFDYHGVGESTGDQGPFRLDEPNVVDLRAALDWLRVRGLPRLLLVGVCFGARTAIQVADERTDVEGLVLISMPVVDTVAGTGTLAVTALAKRLSIAEFARRGLRWSSLRQLVDPAMRRVFVKALRTRLSLPRHPARGNGPAGPVPAALAPTLQGQLTRIRGRVPTLLIYGSGEEEHVGFEHARGCDRSGVLTPAPPVLDLVVGPVPLHGFARLGVQDDVIRTMREWLGRWRPPDAGIAPHGL